MTTRKTATPKPPTPKARRRTWAEEEQMELLAALAHVRAVRPSLEALGEAAGVEAAPERRRPVPAAREAFNPYTRENVVSPREGLRRNDDEGFEIFWPWSTGPRPRRRG